MFEDVLIEKLRYLLASEAAIKEDAEEWESWGTATEDLIRITALQRCIEYLEEEIKQLITSRTESSTMTKPINLSCNNPIFSGSASTSPKKQDMFLRDGINTIDIIEENP